MNFGIQEGKSLLSNWAKSNFPPIVLPYWVLQYPLDVYQSGSQAEFPWLILKFKILLSQQNIKYIIYET